MTHLHHILPRHAGGTDDPSNLVSLSVEDHAEAHRLLWEAHGRIEDRLAWLLLSGQEQGGVELEQYRLAKLRQRYADAPAPPRSVESVTKQRATLQARPRPEGLDFTGRKHRPETKRRIAEALTGQPKSDAVKRAVGQANARRVWTPEMRETLRNAQKARWERYRQNKENRG